MQAYKTVFKTIDSDSSGFIDLDELLAVFSLMEMKQTDAEVRACCAMPCPAMPYRAALGCASWCGPWRHAAMLCCHVMPLFMRLGSYNVGIY